MFVPNASCPRVKLALRPLLKGGTNSRTRLLELSATQRFPLLSKIMPCGSESPFADADWPFSVKLVWPITRLAGIPSEMGCLYSSMRLPPQSDTQMFPSASAIAPTGEYNPVAVVAGTALVKSACPKTVAAFSPFCVGLLNIKIRLLLASAIKTFWALDGGGGADVTEEGLMPAEVEPHARKNPSDKTRVALVAILSNVRRRHFRKTHMTRSLYS